MAQVNFSLIKALRGTISRLENGAEFKWTHMGHCICGNLVQEISPFSAAQIHRFALEKAGDWERQSLDYCGATGYNMDYVMQMLFDLGLERQDIAHLERLTHPQVLETLPLGHRNLDYRNREDVVRYLKAWCVLLEEAYVADNKLPEISEKGVNVVQIA